MSKLKLKNYLNCLWLTAAIIFYHQLLLTGDSYFPLDLRLISMFFFHQGKTIAIFYGSQTGTAEEFAGRLAKDAQRYGLKAAVFDPEEIDIVSNCICTSHTENTL